MGRYSVNNNFNGYVGMPYEKNPFMVHPNDELYYYLYFSATEKKHYRVDPDLANCFSDPIENLALSTLCRAVYLSSEEEFLIPIYGGTNGKKFRKIFEMAKSTWMIRNPYESLGSESITFSTYENSDLPAWSNMTIDQLADVIFKYTSIDDSNHRLVKTFKPRYQ